MGCDGVQNVKLPKEGDLYRIFVVDQHTFDIRYGYYAEDERDRVEPLPIFPNFEKNPVYTKNGEPVTAYVQYPCRHYTPHRSEEPEEWCGDCLYYGGGREEMGPCLCRERRRE